MSREEVNENPVYEVIEEEEEETFTLDFDNKVAFSKEEHLIIKGDLDGDEASSYTWNNNGLTIEEPLTTIAKFPEPPISTLEYKPVEVKPVDPFKNDLQELLLNTIASKAIGSLMKKHNTLDTKLDNLVYNHRMGQLGDLVGNEINDLMYKRRMELRSCFVGSEVRYEKVPDWARSYVKEYTRDMIHGLSVLIEDGE